MNWDRIQTSETNVGFKDEKEIIIQKYHERLFRTIEKYYVRSCDHLVLAEHPSPPRG